MPSFRATVRWTSDRPRYHVDDLDAPDLAAALAQLSAVLPHEVGTHADLLELRVQRRPEDREHTPG